MHALETPVVTGCFMHTLSASLFGLRAQPTACWAAQNTGDAPYSPGLTKPLMEMVPEAEEGEPQTRVVRSSPALLLNKCQ